jgi:GMP synthase (glutamine-hydrolysing)
MMRKIIILYCGSAFTKSLIDKVIELGHIPIMVPSNTSWAALAEMVPDMDGIIITGSGDYVNAVGAAEVDVEIYNKNVPILGICYGMQRMVVDLGGTVKKMAESEVGPSDMEFTEVGDQSELFSDFADGTVPVWMAHNCKVTEIPDFFTVTGYTDLTPVAAIEDPDKKLYGVQYHPEHKGKDISVQAGTAILTRFLQDICA